MKAATTRPVALFVAAIALSAADESHACYCGGSSRLTPKAAAARDVIDELRRLSPLERERLRDPAAIPAQPQPARIPEETRWDMYEPVGGAITLRYPAELLEMNDDNGVVTLRHTVPFDYTWSPHGSEGEYRSNRFVDFRMTIRFEARDLESAMTDRDGRAPSWVHGNEIDAESESVEPVRFGALNGYCVWTGAHCGGARTYFVPFEGGHVIAERPSCYAGEDCGPDCLAALRLVPGVISETASDALFDKIMESIHRSDP